MVSKYQNLLCLERALVPCLQNQAGNAVCLYITDAVVACKHEYPYFTYMKIMLWIYSYFSGDIFFYTSLVLLLTSNVSFLLWCGIVNDKPRCGSLKMPHYNMGGKFSDNNINKTWLSEKNLYLVRFLNTQIYEWK